MNNNTLGIEITNAAVLYFEKLLVMEPENTNIRLTVTNPGTIYADLKIFFCSPAPEELSDVAIKFKTFTLFIEKKSLQFLKDAKIDFLPEEFSEELSVKAPNLKNNSNDKRSLTEKVRDVIDNEINPLLASHGGMIELENIIADSIALVRFAGGCRGCSMADVTFQQTVETILKQYFPELKEIRNVTDEE